MAWKTHQDSKFLFFILFMLLVLGGVEASAQISPVAQRTNVNPNIASSIKMENLPFQKSIDAATFVNQQIPNFTLEAGFGLDNIIDKSLSTFSIIAPEGSYYINIELEGIKDNRKFTIWSEDRRLMATPKIINAGQNQSFKFFANVRHLAIAQAEQDNNNAPKVGIRGDELISRNWDNRLSIDLAGEGVKLAKISIEQTNAPKILLAGDSTVTDQPSGDYASWGQILPAFISNHPIANHARGGETIKSFIFSLRWDKLTSNIRVGDIVLVQFGHNDSKSQWPRTYLAHDGAYPEYLRALVADVRQRGGRPVLISPVARRRFDSIGKIINTHKGYDEAVKNVAMQLGVPFIDLTKETTLFYESLGPDKSKLAFGNNGNDATHHNYYGAYVIAGMVAKSLKAHFPNIELDRSLAMEQGFPDFEATKLDEKLWPKIIDNLSK